MITQDKAAEIAGLSRYAFLLEKELRDAAVNIVLNASSLILPCNSDLSVVLPELFTEIVVPAKLASRKFSVPAGIGTVPG